MSVKLSLVVVFISRAIFTRIIIITTSAGYSVKSVTAPTPFDCRYPFHKAAIR